MLYLIRCEAHRNGDFLGDGNWGSCDDGLIDGYTIPFCDKNRAEEACDKLIKELRDSEDDAEDDAEDVEVVEIKEVHYYKIKE